MSYSLHSDEEKRLQRKLIPLNILVALLALIAAISLIITPLLKVDLGGFLAGIANGIESSADSGNAEEDKKSSSSQYVTVLGNIDAEIVISPIGMFKVLIAPEDKKGATLLNELAPGNEIVEHISVSAVNMMLVVATKEVEADKLEYVDLPALNDALMKADGAKSEEEVLSVLDGYLAVLEKQDGVTLTDDMKEAAKEHTVEFYNNTVEATGGSFSVEKMICVNMAPEGKSYTGYTDLLAGMLNGDFSSDGSDSILATVGDLLNTIAAFYGYVFVYVAVHALLWFILFLFAFFRIFVKNKRFTTWYVKLVGCWPCIIFFLVPFALAKAAPQVAEIAAWAGAFTAFSSMAWISGACYLLLWLFSICWAFPIKHKIRKLRKS